MNPISKIIKIYNKIYNRWVLLRQKVSSKGELNIRGRIYIDNKGSIHFGNNVRINSGRNENIIGGGDRTNLIVLTNGLIQIGEGTGMSNVTLVAKKEIVIESKVMIGGSVKIYDNDFHSIHFSKRIKTPDLDINSAPVKVKEGAFIGAHSIILKGVTIGEFSVVGAGSVVTKSIPAGQVWAGNPARFIKNLEEPLLKTKNLF
ncbi:acyltransferase [Priestia aryabhattai]|uniref:acyltransferase n=1 Tax=Priestia aryabhattai TaxID=412384 RepID=UPI001DCC3CD6|nr:acyltransferase [Priestia aryabhattai]MBX9969231.1 acyltransferase [Priestia aryabhattai]